MDIFTTYSVRIDRFTRIFQDTVNWYRRSVDFFIRVSLLEKEELFRLKTQKERVNAVEKLTVITSCRPEVKYDCKGAELTPWLWTGGTREVRTRHRLMILVDMGGSLP